MNTLFRQDYFEQAPVVGILRGFSLTQTRHIVAAAVRGGLRNIEITMNSPGAAEQIRAAAEVADGALNVGAGTVTSLDRLAEALAAGASFIVTPTVEPQVIQACVEARVPVFPGGFTPTEIFRAWSLGATMVKVFPADFLGPAYIKSLKAPLPNLRLMPTGGVDLASLPAYRQAGAAAFGVGNPLFDKARIEQADWPWIEQRCRAFASASTAPAVKS